MPDPLRRLRHRKVCEVLRQWDPIGVLSDPTCPRDEYDSYSPQFMRILDSGPALDDLVRWMTDLATTRMGIDSVDRAHTSTCARHLFDLSHQTPPASP